MGKTSLSFLKMNISVGNLHLGTPLSSSSPKGPILLPTGERLSGARVQGTPIFHASISRWSVCRIIPFFSFRAVLWRVWRCCVSVWWSSRFVIFFGALTFYALRLWLNNKLGYIWIVLFLLWGDGHFLAVLGRSVQLSYVSPKYLYFLCALLFFCVLPRFWSSLCSLSSPERRDGSWHFQFCWKFCTPFPSFW